MRRGLNDKLVRRSPTRARDVDPWIQEIILLPNSLQTTSRYGLMLERRGPYVLIVVTELPDNPGPSVTNDVARIATTLLCQHPKLVDVAPSALFVVERYCADYRQLRQGDTFTLVRMQWSEAIGYHDPEWHPIIRFTPPNPTGRAAPVQSATSQTGNSNEYDTAPDAMRSPDPSRHRTSFKP